MHPSARRASVVTNVQGRRPQTYLIILAHWKIASASSKPFVTTGRWRISYTIYWMSSWARTVGSSGWEKQPRIWSYSSRPISSFCSGSRARSVSWSLASEFSTLNYPRCSSSRLSYRQRVIHQPWESEHNLSLFSEEKIFGLGPCIIIKEEKFYFLSANKSVSQRELCDLCAFLHKNTYCESPPLRCFWNKL